MNGAARAQAFHEFDLDGDGALTPVELKELTAAIGLVRPPSSSRAWRLQGV